MNKTRPLPTILMLGSQYAYFVASLGGVLGIVGAILAFIQDYPLQYGIIGIILSGICLLLEIPVFRSGSISHPILRSIWYFLSGIGFIVLGIFTVNPVMGLYISAGVVHLIASFLYLLSRFHGRTKQRTGLRRRHERV